MKSFCISIKQGEIFGLLGPNGAGKTTIISMITGIFPPSSGKAYIAGFDVEKEIDQIHLCKFNLKYKKINI